MSEPAKAIVSGWLYQPFESGGRAGAELVICGGVASYGSENVRAVVFPARSTHEPESEAEPSSGAEYVFGALRAYLDGIFDDKVFVVSFVSNVLIAALIVYLGDQLGVGGQLSTGVVVVLGIRIFSNVAAIRRHLFHA